MCKVVGRSCASWTAGCERSCALHFYTVAQVDASCVANHVNDRTFPVLESTAIAAIVEDIAVADAATADAGVGHL